MSWRPVIALLVVAGLLIQGCSRSPGKNARLSQDLESADRTVITMRYGRSGSSKTSTRRLEYGKGETHEIARALLAARPDDGVYDTPVTLHAVSIYAQQKLLAEFGTCSGLLCYQGKQYRDESKTLARLVDSPMGKAEEIEPTAPEPPDGTDAAR